MVARAAALAALALAAACGGNDVEPPWVEVREPGQGSGALLVQAFVKGEAVVPNATDPERFRTRLVVTVKRGIIPVTNALVRVNDVVLVHRGRGLYGEPSQLVGLPPGVAVLSAPGATG